MPIPACRRVWISCAPGFTLIELLVVVAVISLLIGLLVPALAAARETANGLVCQSNMRQIGIGFYTYATDYDDRLVPHSWADEELADLFGFFNTRRTWCVAEIDGDPEELFAASSVGRYLDSVEQIAGCPNWDPPAEYLQENFYDNEFVHNYPALDYGYNGKMLGIPSPLPQEGPSRWIPFRISALKGPSTTIMLADHAVYVTDATGNLMFSAEFELQPPAPDDYGPRAASSATSEGATVHGRHRDGRANALWVDGHVSEHVVRLEESAPEEREFQLGDIFEGDTPTNDWWDGGIRNRDTTSE
ncbi:MAG: prepilin-type N-terminal cleavage/methylation domain-containing protein [Planctomycetota bacterium]